MTYKIEIRLKDGWVDVSLCNATLIEYDSLIEAQKAIDATQGRFADNNKSKPLLRIVRK